jgi:hypothetical protein
MHADVQRAEHRCDLAAGAKRPATVIYMPTYDTKTMSTVKYVVGSESQQWVESSQLHTGWHLGNDGGRAPEGLRHAVDVDAATTACGLPVSVFFVFDDLDWATMISNEMCPECKRAAF